MKSRIHPRDCRCADCPPARPQSDGHDLAIFAFAGLAIVFGLALIMRGLSVWSPL